MKQAVHGIYGTDWLRRQAFDLLVRRSGHMTTSERYEYVAHLLMRAGLAGEHRPGVESKTDGLAEAVIS